MNAVHAPVEIFGDGPGKNATVMIWKDGQPEQLEMRWGLRPVEDFGKPISLLRAEGRTVTNRCLIIANDFLLRPGTAPNGKRRKVELITSQLFFCFAGTWRPATSDWPASFAGITVEAYPDIAPFQDRHMAIVHDNDWIPWLDGSGSQDHMLRPLPAGSLRVSGPPLAVTRDLFV